MIRRVLSFFQRFWVEVLITPPSVMAVCRLLYGEAYFDSLSSMLWLSLPWLVMCILSPIGCHWVRKKTLARFTKLEDWDKRILWSFLGYLVCTVGFAKATYAFLIATQYGGLVPSQQHLYFILFVSAMCVLIAATLYEGITYFDKWKEALSEADELEKLHLETQFQSLQSQLNPHFLFNSLNVLSSLIAENPRRAEDFVDELSNVYRYLLRSNERELASVANELRFIHSFFHLLETRHSQGITLDIRVAKTLYDRQLPALALQILVENAVKHNEISPEKPLQIEIADEGPDTIVVRNNHQRKTNTRPQSNHVGLDNLRQRYALLDAPGFKVNDDGRSFEVTLPLI